LGEPQLSLVTRTAPRQQQGPIDLCPVRTGVDLGGNGLETHAIAIESTATGTLVLNPELYSKDGTGAGIEDLGDETTILGMEGAHTWRGSQGVPIFHIDPSAQVGVGTESPAYPLDVEGEIRTTAGIVFPDGSIQTTACTCP
jgi:hypothetical protein